MTATTPAPTNAEIMKAAATTGLTWDETEVRRMVDELAKADRVGDIAWIDEVGRVMLTSPTAAIGGFVGVKVVVPGPRGFTSADHARRELHRALTGPTGKS